MKQGKVCLVGDFGVGKTSLFNRFVYSRFDERYLTTVGVRIQRRVVELGAEQVALLLWDIEGAHAGASLRMSYLGGAAAAVLVCDLTRDTTADRCAEYAAQLRQLNPRIAVHMAANKADLTPPDAQGRRRAREVADLIRAPLTVTSAQSGEGVDELFRALGEGLAYG